MSDDLYLEQLAFGPMANFVYLVGSKRTREVAIVDPAWEINGLLEHIRSRELTPVASPFSAALVQAFSAPSWS